MGHTFPRKLSFYIVAALFLSSAVLSDCKGKNRLPAGVLIMQNPGMAGNNLQVISADGTKWVDSDAKNNSVSLIEIL